MIPFNSFIMLNHMKSTVADSASVILYLEIGESATYLFSREIVWLGYNNDKFKSSEY